MVKTNNIRAKKIFCVVAYDIKNDRKRAHVSKALEKYGTRINYSVFECMLTELQFLKIQEKLLKQINEKEDTIVFYPICIKCFTKIIYKPKRRKAVQTIQII